MKKYKILKAFKGTQNGNSPAITFNVGDIVEISDYLAEVVLKENMIILIADEIEADKIVPELKRKTKIFSPKEIK